MTTDEPPRYLLPAGELGPEEQCRFCPERVQFGMTVNGNRAPFDLAAPHVNHWSTCEGRQQARKAYPPRTTHPQKPRRGR